MRSFQLSSFVGVALLSGALFSVAGLAEGSRTLPSTRQFVAEIRIHFASWNASHDGNLTKAEIEIAMQNPEFKGDSGATLAALKWAMQLPLDDKTGALQKPPVTLIALDAFENSSSGDPKIDAPVLNEAAYRFVRTQKIVASASRELFANGSPHLAAIHQNWDSDCYFNSGVGAIAYSSPESIVRLIQPASDGAFYVTFPGKPPRKIPAPTDAEIAAYTNADGVWFNVLEKAFATIREFAPGKSTQEPLDSVTLVGGSENQIVALLSGHRVVSTAFPHSTGKPTSDRLLAGVRQDLESSFRDHHAVVASKYHHAYAVVAFDARTDTVTIHNPYDGNGYEGLPNGDHVVSSGGYFSIPTAEFIENFNGMGVETSTPAKI